MLQEYAVEPAAIASSWEEFRFLSGQFGFEKGRIISRLPKKWEKSVISAAKRSGMGDIRIASLIDRLNREGFRRAVVNTGRDFNPEVSWIENAISQHASRPFHAIISTTGIDECDCVLAPEFDEDHPKFSASHDWLVRRTGLDLASSISPMLGAAKNVLIVDPFFDLRNPKGQNFTAALAEILKLMPASQDEPAICQIHYRTHDSRPNVDFIANNARKWINGVIPEGTVVELYEWSEIYGGEDFHDRYMLCDFGGISIGAGFEVVGAHETALVSLMSFHVSQEIKLRFTRGAGVYDLVQPVLAIASDGSVTRK